MDQKKNEYFKSKTWILCAQQILNSLWIRKTNQMPLFVFFISLVIVALCNCCRRGCYRFPNFENAYVQGPLLNGIISLLSKMGKYVLKY